MITSTSTIGDLSMITNTAFGDFSLPVIILCSILLGIIILNHIIHAAGGDHVDFGIDEDDLPHL